MASFTALCFAVWLIGGIFDAGAAPDSEDADSYSKDPTGHHAFAALLEASGMNVVRSRFQSSRMTGEGTLLVLAEPVLGDDDEERRMALLDAPGDKLLVLPKRRRIDSPPPLMRFEEISKSAVDRVLNHADDGATTARLPGASVRLGSIDYRPPGGLQVVAMQAGLDAVLSVSGGAVLLRTRRGDGTLWVLSDPDLIATHGLATPGLPSFVVRMVRDAVPGGTRRVVIDETIHGYEQAPSFWTRFSTPPLGYVLLHAGLAFALALWAGAVRFGPPRREAARRTEGKTALVALTADLLAAVRGGAAAAVARHADLRLKDAAARFGIDPTLPRNELIPLVDAAAAARRNPARFAETVRLVATAERGRNRRRTDEDIIAAAQSLAAWKASLHGSRGSPHAR